MSEPLKGLKIAMLVTTGFEQSELLDPKTALEKAGAEVQIISPEKDKVKGWQHDDWGKEVPVDVVLSAAKASDYAALVLPGGVINPDKLRITKGAIEFIKEFVAADKPIAAICHGPWTLIDAGAVKGRTVTSWPSLKADLTNAGAQWVDKEMVRDGKLVTSRKPEDIPAFCEATIKMIAESAH